MDVSKIIQGRKTSKVLAPVSWGSTLSEVEQQELIKTLLESAAYAPFHYPASARYKKEERETTGNFPFRAYTLTASQCRTLATFIEEHDVQAGKVKNMLWAADAMIVMTWLPDVFGETAALPAEEFIAEPLPFVGNTRNMEHIAATAAAIQNMLLKATELGHLNYWSSGGMLRQQVLRDPMGVPMTEIMLGCIFAFPGDSLERGAEVKAGKHRSLEKDTELWAVASSL